jgi:hypothetical protein
MHGHDKRHWRLLRSKSVLHAAFAKATAAQKQTTKLKLYEETRWQVAGEAVEELRRRGGSSLVGTHICGAPQKFTGLNNVA